MSWYKRQSPIIKTSLAFLAGLAVLLIGVALFVPKTDNTPAATSETPAQANIFLVASKSFCVPTGIDDAYTGDGKVTFFLTFRNSGAEDGTAGAIPVRHYSDGDINESVLDEVNVDIPAGSTNGFHTSAMTYKAHQHQVDSCGVILDGRGEVPIGVRKN